MVEKYSAKIAALLSIGKVQELDPWHDYSAMGLTKENFGELIQMATDRKLNQMSPQSNEIWGPLHAWRALGQLKATEAVSPLLELLNRLHDDAWVRFDLPDVFARIGKNALDEMSEFISNDQKNDYARGVAVSSIIFLCKEHPEIEHRCIDLLTTQLTRHHKNGKYLNAFIIDSMIDLKAKGCIDLIRSAFSENNVELSFSGDLEDVEIDLGLRKERSTPRPLYNHFSEEEAERLINLNITDDFDIISFNDVGRNDPCPCGSGRKFKKCCLN